MRIENNTLNVNGPGHPLRASTSRGSRATASTGRRRATGRPSGSGIALVTAFDPTGSDQCQLLANQVSGFPDAGILITAPVQDLIASSTSSSAAATAS